MDILSQRLPVKPVLHLGKVDPVVLAFRPNSVGRCRKVRIGEAAGMNPDQPRPRFSTEVDRNATGWTEMKIDRPTRVRGT